MSAESSSTLYPIVGHSFVSYGTYDLVD